MPQTIDPTKTLPLVLRDRQGQNVGHAVVDAEDFGRLYGHKWHRLAGDYAGRRDESGRVVFLHREIMGVTDPRIEIDHANRDPLDNRKSNLRVCTHAENHQNKSSTSKGSSRYRGVSWHKHRGKWFVRHKLNGRQIFIGYFEDEDAAGEAAAAWRAEHMPFSAEAHAAA